MLESARLSMPGLRIINLPVNCGKGAAVLAGMAAARRSSFDYAMVMDSDGQHPPQFIPHFIELSRQNPGAMILGTPDFGPDAPLSRSKGRRVGNWWANLETLWGGKHDSLFGFRLYPLAESLAIMGKLRGGRRFDFDTILGVRLYWQGVKLINVKVPVRYFSRNEGGVSHFNYVRDNLLLFKAHVTLVLGLISRLRAVWRLRKR